MPIAAVPHYVQRYIQGKSFEAASPALRFGLLLPIWTTRKDQEEELRKRSERRSREAAGLQQLIRANGMAAAIARLVADKSLPGVWDKNDAGARRVWQGLARLNETDQDCMKALLERQRACAETLPSARLLRLEAVSTAPFTTGLGNAHPLENGFSFLNPYGLPYLPGSGVKGVVRQAARELAGGAWPNAHRWDDTPRYEFPSADDEEPAPKLTCAEVLFGRETEEGKTDHFRGVLTFWDVIPRILVESLVESLLVEIMTPHQSHYYQQKPEAGSTTPHDSGQPNPICFLTVPPGSKFVFHVDCDLVRLKRLAPDLLENERWKTILEAAFEHAFRWLGFGAKTAVGYGAMQMHREADPPPGPDPKTPASTETEIWTGATLRYNPGQQNVTARRGHQDTAPLRGDALASLFGRLGPERTEQLKRKKTLGPIDVKVTKEGNLIRLIGLAD
jgi:CRISPR-associated protein Cmr6